MYAGRFLQLPLLLNAVVSSSGSCQYTVTSVFSSYVRYLFFSGELAPLLETSLPFRDAVVLQVEGG